MGHNVSMQVPIGAILLASLALTLVPAAQAQTVTIAVTSLTVQAAANDTPPKNKANKGDSISFRDLLYNRLPQFGKKTGKAVAYDVGVIRYLSSTKTMMTVKAIFPGFGTITYSGPFDSNLKSNVLTITGGSGGFNGATGSVTIGAGATKSPNTYQLTIPGHVDLNGGGVA